MIATVNKRLWQLHSVMGLIAGMGLLMIGLTGSLLVFHDELDAAISPDMFLAPPISTARVPLDILLAAVEKGLPDYEVSSWSFACAPDAVDRVYVVKHEHRERLLVTVNPHTGSILGGPLDARRTVTGWVLDLHYSFLAGRVGTLVAGIFAALLCLLGLSGFWLYRDFWRNFMRLRWRASLHVLLSDLHKTVGIASLVFHLILGFTGAYWNFPSAIRQFRFGNGLPPELTGRHWSHSISLDALLQRSRQDLPGFQPTFIAFPGGPGADIQIFGHSGSPLRGDYGSAVTFHPQSGARTAIREIRKAGLWGQITDAFRPLHYGTFGGLFVKTVWCAGGLTPGLLAITGFLMWRQRQVGRNVKN
jgi:uncharacterized iron-regulated membrane protein